VSDDGSGFDAAAVANGGFGLTGMCERAELVGGELSVARGSSAGTVVRARLPLGRATYSGPTSPWSSA
jgi:two-component system sensor histidine kinase DegS